MLNVRLIRMCDRLAEDELEHIADGIQRQLQEDFLPRWHLQAKVTTVEAASEECLIYVVDRVPDAPEGAWGWHTLDDNGTPYGIVPLYYSDYVQEPVSVGISREVLNMVVDPWLRMCVVELWPHFSRKVTNLALDVTSPVRGESYAVEVDDGPVRVSNFVLPNWFRFDSKGPYDQLGLLQEPFLVVRDGSMLWQRSGAAWHQTLFDRSSPPPPDQHLHSREFRRQRIWHEYRKPGYHRRLSEWETKLRADGDMELLRESALWAVSNLGQVGLADEGEVCDAGNAAGDGEHDRGY